MQFNPENPLIVQKDMSVLAEAGNRFYAEARSELVRFSELTKTPEHIHTFQITPLSIWNACSNGINIESIIDTLSRFSKMAVSEAIVSELNEIYDRYGKIRLTQSIGKYYLTFTELKLAQKISKLPQIWELIIKRDGPRTYLIDESFRGELKQRLIRLGYPVEDHAGYRKGNPLKVDLRDTTLGGFPFHVRDYQSKAADQFYADGTVEGGSGVVVLPCGAGKTIVGTKIMSLVNESTLILTTSTTAVKQWKNELRDKTQLTEDQIGEYTAATKQIKPVTVATYSIVTHRTNSKKEFRHLELFDSQNWGLIIYDEVHMLPAPVFKFSAALQSRRRLGLTATLVREDKKEDEVFALVGPKKADVPWRELESQGWIASAECTEIRIPLEEKAEWRYIDSDKRTRFNISSKNVNKSFVVNDLLKKHRGEQILIIGMFLDQLNEIASVLRVPLITGETPNDKREELFKAFRERDISVMVVSKIANFAIDLPDASVAIQISGTFGSRQEEAQRLGRILRPKSGRNQAHFYTLVSKDTVEQEFSLRRQMFLCEQGYQYSIIDY